MRAEIDATGLKPQRTPSGQPHRRSRVEKKRGAVHRLVHKHFRDDLPDLIVLEYEYWMLRGMGCDILEEEFRYPRRGLRRGENLLRPRETPAWVWWMELHYTQRFELARENQHR